MAAARPLALALVLSLPIGGAAQERGSGTRIVSSEIALSRPLAVLQLGLENGRTAEFAIHDGRAFVNGEDVGEARRGGDLDRAWRDLLQEAMEAETDELAGLFAEWDPPGEQALETALHEFLESGGAVAQNITVTVESADEAELSDSVHRLVERIAELQAEVATLEDVNVEPGPVRITIPDRRGRFGPFRHIAGGIAGIFSTLIFYAVMFAIAFATIFFGGRRFIEGVADTARSAPTRSMLVGLAAAFLVIPAFILGIIALAISIVGIPALLLWIPLYPVAAGVALLLGYIGVSHAAGEALAERRFHGTDWFQRGNSYYFVLTGLGLLLALFMASHVVSMAGPWLGFLRGILFAIGMVVTFAAMSIGLGAVLLSRGGTRPIRKAPVADPEFYAESTHA
ncbi:MAG: hypothetical protein L0271_03075 [Gemmatimonadetes bacterium]|nr:hypothetical protein [Gemmatimonadota bacterium]